MENRNNLNCRTTFLFKKQHFKVSYKKCKFKDHITIYLFCFLKKDYVKKNWFPLYRKKLLVSALTLDIYYSLLCPEHHIPVWS